MLAAQYLSLIQCEQSPSARRTNILVVEFARWRYIPKVETDLIQHCFQIVDVKL